MPSTEVTVNLEKALKITLKTGKIIIGSKRTLKALKFNNAKLIILANNCKKEIRDEIYHLLSLGDGIKHYEYSGNSHDLGYLCGKPYMVSVIAIQNPGDSNILEIAN